MVWRPGVTTRRLATKRSVDDNVTEANSSNGISFEEIPHSPQFLRPLFLGTRAPLSRHGCQQNVQYPIAGCADAKFAPHKRMAARRDPATLGAGEGMLMHVVLRDSTTTFNWPFVCKQRLTQNKHGTLPTNLPHRANSQPACPKLLPALEFHFHGTDDEANGSIVPTLRDRVL